MNGEDAVGWAASLLLMATVGSQVWKQIREKSCDGVSRFLFIGQLFASLLFLAYAWMVGNAVFIASNTFLVMAALVGQLAMLRNQRRQARAEAR